MSQTMIRRGGDPEIRELWRHLGALRRRLWWERAAGLGVRALVLGFGMALLAAIVAWFLSAPLHPTLYGGPVAAALGLAVVASLFRYPSLMEVARSADRRLELDERLGTAVELAGTGQFRAGGPLARRQLVTAIEAAGWARDHWQGDSRAGRPLTLAAVFGVLTAAVLLLTGLEERLAVPIPRPSIWSLLPQAETTAESPATMPVVEEVAPRSQAGPPAGETAGRTGAVSRSLDDLRQAREAGAIGPQQAADRLSRAEGELDRQTQASRGQREGLDRLGRALDQVAAGQPASEAIQRGDYERAGQEIAALGTESDQLSAQAKAQLAQALRSAAAESQASPELAARERRAADALAGRDYEAARRAMQDLGEEVTRRGRDVVPQQELARAWDQVNQERRAQGQPERAGGQPERPPQSQPGQQPAQGQQGQTQGQRAPQAGAGQAQGQPDAAGGQNAGAGAGEEAGGNGPGAESEGPAGEGSGSGGQPNGQATGSAPSMQPGSEFPTAGQAPRLDVQGRPVEVDVKPGQQNARRQGEAGDDPNEQPSDEVGAISAVSGDAPRSITSAAPSESNFVPSDRREVVRGYFTNQGTQRQEGR